MAVPGVVASGTTTFASVRPSPPAAVGSRRAVWRRNGGCGASSVPTGECMRRQCWVCLEWPPQAEGAF
eukprot:6346091-Lingulodinium_polyedra.AAC.1